MIPPEIRKQDGSFIETSRQMTLFDIYVRLNAIGMRSVVVTEQYNIQADTMEYRYDFVSNERAGELINQTPAGTYRAQIVMRMP